MMRKSRLELVNRLGGDACGQDFMQPQEGVMIALEPGYAGLDRQARLGGLGNGCQARQGRQAAIGLIIHVSFGAHSASILSRKHESTKARKNNSNDYRPG